MWMCTEEAHTGWREKGTRFASLRVRASVRVGQVWWTRPDGRRRSNTERTRLRWGSCWGFSVCRCCVRLPSCTSVTRGLHGTSCCEITWRCRGQRCRNPFVVCSDTSLLLQVASWEMRLVLPMGVMPPPEPADIDVASQQRLEMKRALCQKLQDTVRSFLVSTYHFPIGICHLGNPMKTRKGQLFVCCVHAPCSCLVSPSHHMWKMWVYRFEPSRCGCNSYDFLCKNIMCCSERV